MARNIVLCFLRSIHHRKHRLEICYQYLTRDYHLSSHNSSINTDYHDVKSYKQYLEEVGTGPGRAVITLMRTLDVTKENAIDAVKIWKVFGGLSKQIILENHSILREAGVDKSTLRQNMYALADSTANLKQKIGIIQKINLEINSSIPLFQLTAKNLAHLGWLTNEDKLIAPGYNNRIDYLSQKLNHEVYPLCVILCDHIYILKMPMKKIVEITEHLLEVKMPPENLLKDLNIYNYSSKTIKSRTEWAIRAGISPLKPWIVRCPESVLEKNEARKNSRETILETAGTLEKYICQLFNCDSTVVNAIFKRDPSILSINLKKISTNLQLLRDYGYAIDEIYRAPSCLHCHNKSMKKKYATWVEQGLGKPPLSMLCTSKRLFAEKLLQVQQSQQKKT